MTHTTNDSEDGMFSKDQTDSPSVDEGSCGGSFEGGGGVLKKGPWTSAEDAILVEYVKKHGEGNWNAVQKHSGLFRCGKSCRLRWANHLRPNLKKGAFTTEEERLIVELHAKMGNKWARMAAHLPGRTDNEIKNYWNTRIKRRQRAGLPLYPSGMNIQALNENQQSHNTGELSGADIWPPDLLQTNNYEIPDVIFDNLHATQGGFSYTTPIPDISMNSMLTHGLCSSKNYSLMPPTMHRPKRLRESETLFPDFSTNSFDQFQNDSFEKIHRPSELSFPYDPDPNGKNSPPFGIIPGSHSLMNGNFSTSKPISRAVKLELPSLQYPDTDFGSWGTSSPLQPPPLEPVDAFIQSSDSLSPRNSGLLEALIHEAQTLNNVKSHSSEKSSTSAITPSDIVDCSTLNLCETDLDEYGDPISPLGRSAASVFSECTPISGCSMQEPPTTETLPVSNIKLEPFEYVSTPDVTEKEISTRLDYSRPDALLGLTWFEQSNESGKDQSTVTDAISTLLSEEFCSDYKHNMAAAGGTTSTSSQGWGFGSCAWNNMPAVCQMSELP